MGDRSTRSLISLSWQSIAYGIGIFGRYFLVFLTLPLFTNYMPQAEYGVVSVLTASLSFINILTNAGLPSAVFRLYNDDQDHNRRRYILGSSLLLFFLFALIPAVGMFLAAGSFSQLLLGSSAYGATLQVVAGVLVFETLINYGFILLRIQVRPLGTSLLNLFMFGSQTGFALLFVRVYDLGAMGYFLGYLLGAFLAVLALIGMTRQMLFFKATKGVLRELLAYGLPLIPATLAMWALRLADRSLIVRYTGLEQVAVYEIGYKVGMLVAMVILPFNAAWPQFAFSTMRKPDAAQTYRDVLTFITVLLAFVALGVIAVGPELVDILAPQSYAEAVIVIPWVAFSQVAWGMYRVLSLGPKITKKTIYLTVVAVTAAAVNIALNILLIPRLGILAAAINTLIAYALLAFLSYIVGQRLYPFPLDWSRLGKISLASVLTLLLVFQSSSLQIPGVGETILRVSSLLLYPILLLLMNFIDLRQGKALWQLGTGLLRERLGKV